MDRLPAPVGLTGSSAMTSTPRSQSSATEDEFESPQALAMKWWAMQESNLQPDD